MTLLPVSVLIDPRLFAVPTWEHSVPSETLQNLLNGFLELLPFIMLIGHMALESIRRGSPLHADGTVMLEIVLHLSAFQKLCPGASL